MLAMELGFSSRMLTRDQCIPPRVLRSKHFRRGCYRSTRATNTQSEHMSYRDIPTRVCGAGNLDKEEFCIAMALVGRCLEGTPAPSTLPKALMPPSKRSAGKQAVKPPAVSKPPEPEKVQAPPPRPPTTKVTPPPAPPPTAPTQTTDASSPASTGGGGAAGSAASDDCTWVADF